MNWIKYKRGSDYQLQAGDLVKEVYRVSKKSAPAKDAPEEIYLVGEINELGGMCDCCTVWHDKVDYYYSSDIREQIQGLIKGV